MSQVRVLPGAPAKLATAPSRGRRKLYKDGTAKGLNSDHVRKLRSVLTALDGAEAPGDMDIAGWRLKNPTRPGEVVRDAIKNGLGLTVTAAAEGARRVAQDALCGGQFRSAALVPWTCYSGLLLRPVLKVDSGSARCRRVLESMRDGPFPSGILLRPDRSEPRCRHRPAVRIARCAAEPALVLGNRTPLPANQCCELTRPIEGISTFDRFIPDRLPFSDARRPEMIPTNFTRDWSMASRDPAGRDGLCKPRPLVRIEVSRLFY